MTSRSIVSPEDQSATFVELFFDLVFVFSVTQVVSLFHHHLEPVVLLRAILVFWMVWWAWTQFTWALNAADTTHHHVQMGTLVATGVAFLMAVSLPDAFAGRALWFAMPYVVVRSIGLTLYIWVASANPPQRAAVMRFAVFSVGGLVAVILGGLFAGVAQYALWGLGIGLDVLAALSVRPEGWDLHAEHFTERHALFVIIALGETLIVAALGLSGSQWPPEKLLVGLFAVTVACGYWWMYFSRYKPLMDHALASQEEARLAPMARDAFSLLHFPILCGIVAFAVGLETAIAHPADPLTLPARMAFGLSILLYGGGMVASARRATGRLLVPRLVVTLLLSAGVLIAPVDPAVALAVLFLGTVLIAVAERGLSISS